MSEDCADAEVLGTYWYMRLDIFDGWVLYHCYLIKLKIADGGGWAELMIRLVLTTGIDFSNRYSLLYTICHQ